MQVFHPRILHDFSKQTEAMEIVISMTVHIYIYIYIGKSPSILDCAQERGEISHSTQQTRDCVGTKGRNEQ